MSTRTPTRSASTTGAGVDAPHDPGRRATRVLVVEDHVLLAEALEMAVSVLGFDARVRSPEPGTTPKALLAWIVRQRPQLVLLDLDLGALGDSTCLITPLTHAGIEVVVLTGSTDQVSWGGCLAAGAATVVPKATPLGDVMSVVRRLAAGQPVLPVEERERLVSLWQVGRAERRVAVERLRLLTRREQLVMGHLQRGHAVREIAERLVVSEATVRTQVKAILSKLEVSSQLAAVGLANGVDWVAPAVAPAPLAGTLTSLVPPAAATSATSVTSEPSVAVAR